MQGPIHNGLAINTLVFFYDDPNDWVFKQFVSQSQLEAFAIEHQLAIVFPTKKE